MLSGLFDAWNFSRSVLHLFSNRVAGGVWEVRILVRCPPDLTTSQAVGVVRKRDTTWKTLSTPGARACNARNDYETLLNTCLVSVPPLHPGTSTASLKLARPGDLVTLTAVRAANQSLSVRTVGFLAWCIAATALMYASRSGSAAAVSGAQA